MRNDNAISNCAPPSGFSVNQPSLNLSQALASSHFSLDTLETILKQKQISLQYLDHNLKEELADLCVELPTTETKLYFLSNLIHWTERRVREIPLDSRTHDGDAGTLVAIQKFAVDQLFFPDTTRGNALDRWQFLKDYLQVSNRKWYCAPLLPMRFKSADEDDGLDSYIDEFRFAGNSRVEDWRYAPESLSSLGEYINYSPHKDKYTYENHQEADADSRHSFNPVIKAGKLTTPDGDYLEGSYMYVLRPDHTLSIAIDLNKPRHFHHSYMNNGLPVICAGHLKICKGKIVDVNIKSGHYRPFLKNLAFAIDIFRQKGIMLDEKYGTLVHNYPNKHKPIKSQQLPAWQVTANRFIRDFKGKY